MAALIINFQGNKTITRGVAFEAVPIRAGRKFFEIQLQATGFLWVRFDGLAAKDLGFRIAGWQRYAAGQAVEARGDSINFYEGPVSVFWEGGRDLNNEYADTAQIRVLEVS